MDRQDGAMEDLLLDLHLEQVSEEQREWLRDQFDSDAALASRNQKLTRLLGPLDLWAASAPPNDLPERVLDHVRSRSLTVVPAVADEKRAARVGVSWFRLREMVAAAACVGLLVGVVIPGLSNVRDRSRRALCANNLGTLFDATSTYQASFAGALPYAGFVPDSSWLACDDSDLEYASNSRHVFRLLCGEYGATPSSFVCPADAAANLMGVGDPSDHNDFARASNVSYASLNLAGRLPNLRPHQRVAYLSDRNPLFERARFKSGIDPDTTNSPVHSGRGQSVLLLDGNVQWLTSPIYGPKKDNLWLVGNIRKYTGCESPEADDDAQLIPGFPAKDCLGGVDTN